ncbi:M24 family metallopeptidase, partial [Halomarina rubra]
MTGSERTERLDRYLARKGLEAVWFARPNDFAWLTGGDNVVSASAPVGVAAAGYDGERVVVVTDDIEAPRLRAEELDDLDDAAVETFAWHDSSLAATVAEVSATPAAADFDVPGFETVDASSLRQPLSDGDVETYRSLAGDVARAVESVCRGAEPESTERAVSADLQRALAARGCRVPVALVGGEERAPAYRHFTPTEAELGGYAVASVTAERDGLSVSLTRTVAFDPPAWLTERHA